MVGVLWLLVYLALILGSLGVLVLCALRVWGKVRAARAAAAELRERVADLAAQTSELAQRLESVDAVANRLAARGR